VGIGAETPSTTDTAILAFIVFSVGGALLAWLVAHRLRNKVPCLAKHLAESDARPE
jgi:hypothetical protein